MTNVSPTKQPFGPQSLAVDKQKKSPLIKIDDFGEVDQTKAINSIVYGLPIKVLTNPKKSTVTTCVFALCGNDFNHMECIRPEKKQKLAVTKIELNEISSITNVKTNPAKNKNSLFDSEYMLKILYGKNKQFLLVFDDLETKGHFWGGLMYFMERATQEEEKIKDTKVLFARDVFRKNDKDGNHFLTTKEVKDTIKKLGVNMKEETLNTLIQEYDVNKDGKFSYEEFEEFLNNILRKEEVQEIFNKYSSSTFEHKNGGVYKMMSPKDLMRFYQHEQKQPMTLENIRELSDSLAAAEMDDYVVTFDVFNSILFSPTNMIFNSAYLKPYQDFTRPLTDYYVSSSHNTYLLSNQLTGESSVQAYINALKKGCRCVELDLWDGPNFEPIIYHGHTMTTKILFKDVIVALKQQAFVDNPFPLILSFEMHCGLKAQKKIADILKSTIADLLFVVPDDHENHKYYGTIESLKNKFIIKCKGKLTLKENVDCEEIGELMNNHRINLAQITQGVYVPEDKTLKILSHRGPRQPFEKKITLAAEKGKEDVPISATDIDIKANEPRKFLKYQSAVDQDGLDINNRRHSTLSSKSSFDDETGEKKKKKNKRNFLPELNVLYGMIGRKINLASFCSVYEISSLKEHKIEALFKTSLKEMIEYHKRFLTRIYPGNLRVDSSNYSPITAWATGSQIVALNFQNEDEHMLINYAKFKPNGGKKCGYILKPKYMLHDYKGPEQLSHGDLQKKPVKRVTIRIISAQALRGAAAENEGKNKVNPYVEVKVRGLAVDEKNNKMQKTQVVSNNAFHPVWETKTDQTGFTFEIANPDFSYFVFTVMNDGLGGGKMIGWYAIEFNNMCSGYRNIPLHKKNLKLVKHSYIFCHVSITDL